MGHNGCNQTEYTMKRLLLLLILASATTSMAQHRGEHRLNARSMDGPDSDIASLTPDQKAEIKKIRAAHRSETAPLVDQLKAKRAALSEYRSAGNMDQAKVNAAIEEVFSLKAKLAIKRSESEKAVRDLLTPEQQAQFDAKKKEHLAKRKEHRHEPE